MSERLHLHDANLPEYLGKLGLLPAGTQLAVEPAGDGNINWVRRARCLPDGPSWVVKQARPALERFPEYRVSTRRIVVEARYYQRVAALDRRRVCPGVIHFDPRARVLVLEDLGRALRLDAALERGDDVRDAAAAVAGFLGAVHAATRGEALARRFANREMQRLHGDHIYRLPFRENDFPLPPPLRARAEALRRDAALVARIDAAHARYLGRREVLVHADAQSANILLPPGRPVLLDAEIAHAGDPAFDVGILLAHLLLPALARGDGGHALPALEAAWRAYAAAHGDDAGFPEAARHAAIELLRRTLGAARVPWVEETAAAERVIEAGVSLLATPPTGLRDLERLL